MKYLINRAKLTLTVERFYKIEVGYRIIAHLPNKKNIKLVAIVNKKKMRGIELENKKSYTFEGFLSSTKYSYQSNIYTLQLNIDRVEEVDKNSKPQNVIDIVGSYKDKTPTINLSKDKKVCNIGIDFLSENMKNSGIEIAVWNKAIDAIEYAKEGQKIHLSSFVYDNFCTDKDISLKLSPFKITILS